MVFLQQLGYTGSERTLMRYLEQASPRIATEASSFDAGVGESERPTIAALHRPSC